MKSGVTAVIPTITTRRNYLTRALASVTTQRLPVDQISVWTDQDHMGAAVTRNKAIEAVETEWCAFLDDDDEWMPNHIETLCRSANWHDADIFYPWFEVIAANPFDPFPGVFGRPFDPEDLRRRNYVPTTVLARTELVREVGGFEPYGDQKESACDDWGLWLKLLDKGAKFHHVEVRTWKWHWHGNHTSGLGNRW